MKKALSLAVGLALIGIAGVTAFGGQDGAAYSTKAAVLTKQAPAAKAELNTIASERQCPLCRVPTRINEQVTTKPGHGMVQNTVLVDQCPGCGGKVATELKQTEYVHTCTHHCCGA